MKTKGKKREQGSKSLALVNMYFPKVTKVIDADKPAIVEVTQKDVIKAKIGDPEECALALACTRLFHCDGVLIGFTTSYIIKDKTAIRYKNAETISREVMSFDRKAGFDVGFYNLVPASPSNRLDNPRPSGTKRSPTPKSQRAFRHFTQGVRVLGKS